MTPWPDTELKILFTDLLGGTFSHRGFKRFYDYCYSIAISYLHSKKDSGKLYLRINSHSTLDFQDLATDCLAPLFEQEKDYTFPRIIKWFRTHFPEPAEHSEAVLFLSLKYLIISYVHQELIKFFKDSDPEGYRLLRNLNRTVGCSEELEMFHWGDEHYIFFRDPQKKFPEDYVNGKPLLLYDEMLQMLTERMPLKYRLSILIPELLLAIEAEGRFAPVLTRCLLHNCLRRVIEFFNFDTVGSQMDDESSQSIIMRSEEEILHSLFDELDPHIEKLYGHIPMYNKQISSVYHSFLNDYFTDLLNDGYTDKLPQYWKKIALQSENYEQHKNRLEYLVRIGKEKLKKIQHYF